MADVLTLAAGRGAATTKPPPRKRVRPADAKRARQLVSRIACYLSDMAAAQQRMTARGVHEDDVNVLHALAMRQEQLCGALMTLGGDSWTPERLDDVAAILGKKA